MPSRFEFIKFDDQAKTEHASFTEKFKEIEQDILTIRSTPYRFEAMKCLEACYMWVGKAIRQEQIQRNYDAKDEQKRNQMVAELANDTQVPT